MSDIDQVREYLLSLQNRIVAGLEQLDGKQTFKRDAWDRPGGGGGESRVLKGGGVFEQAGVNFSHVFGSELPPSATKTRPDLAGQGFQAMGVSLVLHPENPYIPTTHANFRFFTAGDEDNDPQGCLQENERPRAPVGNLDVSHLLVEGTQKEVIEAVKNAIRAAGPGGGYILSAAHSHPYVDATRLRWMVEAAHDYGHYPLPG